MLGRKIRIGLAFILVLLQPVAIVSATTRPTLNVPIGKQLECVSDQFIEERLALRLGFIALSRATKGTKPAVECGVKLWPLVRHEPSRDAVSKYLLAVLTIDPVGFISAMTPYQEILDDWLSDLDITAFTWSGEGPCGLDPYKERLFHEVAQAESLLPESLSGNKISRRLEHLRCHMIE